MKKYILFILAGIAATAFYSCADPAIGAEYGEALIYMPQATHNIGTDNNLNLTLKASDVAADQSLRTQTTLGIYRSGTHEKKSATVDLAINTDTLTVAKQLALDPDAASKYDIYKTGELLQAKYYDALPETLTIPDGKREATTQLVLHNKEIFADYAAGDILLLPVQIENPTRYELNKSLSLTMVVIKLED